MSDHESPECARRERQIDCENHAGSCAITTYETYGRISETNRPTSTATEGSMWRLHTSLHEYYWACLLSDEADRECVEALAYILRAERDQRRQLQTTRISEIRRQLGGGSTPPPPLPKQTPKRGQDDNDAGPNQKRSKQAQQTEVIDLVGSDSDEANLPAPIQIVPQHDADNDEADVAPKEEKQEEC
ncbi:hypothetical protein F444_18788 [Phytophthora nicotianae P1976]|uniref:Uncharacterized protein n=1 Tax=Phytophthora nicotianae P1976 TaxID=1317066 RepID=A0A080ZA89_PHYNI|nr:hypothetical protein F444_18788 [Phytophthora nicotianae P1976]